MKQVHISIPVMEKVNVIENTQISPLISKCQVKVMYINENRNGTFISRETAEEMGKKLPGSPIVGYYNPDDKDFETHNRDLEFNGEAYTLVDLTKPYGFVPTDARVWFQDFQEEEGIKTYLVTEGYLWTGTYPECQRTINMGNNQSMELDPDSVKGRFAAGDNGLFIINEATISKLCILGENFEPCFEGASITNEFTFALNDMYSVIAAMSDSLAQERRAAMENIEEKNFSAEGNLVSSDLSENQEVLEEVVETFEVIEEEPIIDSTPVYSLEEIPEYVSLQEDYAQLQNDYNLKISAYEALEAEVSQLREFKLGIELQEKQNMINSFYMLSDEDKQDVQDHIKEYSLDDIEAKLSIICVRNRVNFNLDSEEKEVPMMFSLDLTKEQEIEIPEWIQAVKNKM